MTIDIRDKIPDDLALELVRQVVREGRQSKDNTLYTYLTIFHFDSGDIAVATREYRKSDCFVVYRSKKS